MKKPIEAETDRLYLRQWRPTDCEPFAQMSADPVVMEFFPGTLTRVESDALADRFKLQIEKQGWGFWAVESKVTNEFIGFVGLNALSNEFPFFPGVEIGWRLAFSEWGKSLAFEASKEALHIGFSLLGLNEIVSFTTIANRRSQALMKRLGMRESEIFDHPKLPHGHSLQRHCLYRLSH